MITFIQIMHKECSYVLILLFSSIIFFCWTFERFAKKKLKNENRLKINNEKKIKSLQLTSPMIFSPDDLVNNVGGRVLVRGREKKTIFDFRNTEQNKAEKGIWLYNIKLTTKWKKKTVKTIFGLRNNIFNFWDYIVDGIGRRICILFRQKKPKSSSKSCLSKIKSWSC